MSAPQRVQRRRSKGFRLPPNTVSVVRPGRFGNPFATWTEAGRGGPQVEVNFFRRWLAGGITDAEVHARFHGPNAESEAMIEELNLRRAALLAALPSLRKTNLACWCAIGAPCHADVLLELANS